MKIKFGGFLSILQSVCEISFFEPRKVLLLPAFLSLLFVYAGSVFARQTSLFVFLPDNRQLNFRDDRQAESDPFKDDARAATLPEFDPGAVGLNNRNAKINAEIDFSELRRTNSEKILADLRKRRASFPAVKRAGFVNRQTRKIEGSEFAGRRSDDFLKNLPKDGAFGEFDFGGLKSLNPLGDRQSAADDPTATDDAQREGFRWRAAIEQSLLFLAVQHGYALTQPKTRRALKGSFFGDYFKSVKALRGWGDGGRFFTNYIAHPMQGAMTGYIQIQNDPQGIKERFGNSAGYWRSRLKAMGWSALWSTQFEIGPLSQASIGNIGLYGKQTYVDLIVTPTLGTAMLVTEDAVDRYFIEAIERRTDNYYVMILSRMLLNPTRTMANLIRFKLPWHRDRGRAR